MATSFAQASETISGDLIAHVRFLYKMGKDRISTNRWGDLVPVAVPSYILAVAAVEAFVNEMFLSDFGSLVLGKSLPDGCEKLELRVKLIKLPARVFGRTLPKGERPYQDMDLLVELRNELVHYKMKAKPPKIIKQLAQHKIAVRVPRAEEEQSGGPYPWTRRVGTLEGIRWANNTACATVLALLALAPPEKQPSLAWLGHNFRQIP